MSAKLAPLAIAYDFDGTLAPGNMQERSFIPNIGMTTKEFWTEVRRLSKEQEGDNIQIYMGLMLEKAEAARVPVHRSDFENHGAKVRLFHGVEDWFDRITTYGNSSGVRVEHFIISSGIREMISGTKIASKFKAIFASSYWYDHNGVAKWPALALNYTTKTQYLFRINKGSLHVYDHSKINKYVPQAERPTPFQNIVFIGDGETDIPCFRLVRDQNGHSIAVYKPRNTKARETSEQLVRDGRVDFIAPADYRDGKEIDRIVKAVIEKVAMDAHLRKLARNVN